MLGTAQLGLSYGIVNSTGKLPSETAHAFLQEVLHRKIHHFDTARAYGEAEQRLGNVFASLEMAQANKINVVTKLSPEAHSAEAALESVSESLRLLRYKKLPVLLLHRWAQRSNNDLWQQLRKLQVQGLIGVLGASLSTVDEAISACEDPEIKHIQLPFNLLDKRWHAGGVVAALASRPDLTVHVRSIFLQGILLHGWEKWPKIAGLSQNFPNKLDDLALKFGRENKGDLAVSYVLAQDWIHGVVFGIDSSAQLEENLRFFSKAPLNHAECKQLETELLEAPEELLNPALWPKVAYL